jgi:hypothetical protein
MKQKNSPEVSYYRTLIGKTVSAIVMNQCLGQTTYGLEFTDGTIAWIDCDPEGNGPGFLDIQAPQAVIPDLITRKRE